MSLKDFFGTAGNPRGEKRRPSHIVLIDTSNDTLITIGTYAPSLYFLNEILMDSECMRDVTTSAEVLRIAGSDPRTYPEWSWNSTTRTLRKTNPDMITEEMRKRSLLSTKKMRAVTQVIYIINGFRTKLNTGLLLQDKIYTQKEKEAQYLKDANFDEGALASAPYVVAYATEQHLPLRQAAEEILLQARLDQEYLARTEMIRLGLMKKIRQAAVPEQMDEILENYRKHGNI